MVEIAPFRTGGLVARPGEQVSGFLDVPPGVDGATRIPVTLLHGTQTGPVLALIAGTHGSEYPPILALQRIRRDLDATALTGTVILVHIANLPSFQQRTVYYGPDGKNLNRVYPGNAAGTLSERIAHVITTHVLSVADAVIDLHCGDANEALRPYSYWMRTGNAKLDGATKLLAEAFGVDWIVIDDDRPRDPAASVFTANTAITRGKPAVTTETGELGSSDERWVEPAERGVWNALRHLGMVAGAPLPAPAIVWLTPTQVVRSPDSGMFRPAVRPGETVAAGDRIGTITDYFGDTVCEIRAPFSGLVLYIVATPPVSKGEPLAMIGTPATVPAAHERKE
jgi:hypothetical protein